MSSTNDKCNAATHDLPTLVFHDQTPNPKPDNKSSKISLSPCTEDDEYANKDSLIKKIKNIISMSMKELVPSIIDQMKKEIATMLKTNYNRTSSDWLGIKEDILISLSSGMNQMETRNKLKAQCEAEKLEMYNRRDNVKFLEVPKH